MDDWSKKACPKAEEIVQRHLRVADKTRIYRGIFPVENTFYFAGVREPVSFALSEFFERYFSYDEPESEYSISQIRDAIESGDVFPNALSELDLWFDSEFLPSSGFDVFSQNFPIDRGYLIENGKKGKVCVYRLESFGKVQQMVSETLGVPFDWCKISSTNSASQKDYYEMYKKVCDNISFSHRFLASVYDSRFAKHFYSEKERAAYFYRWGRGNV